MDKVVSKISHLYIGLVIFLNVVALFIIIMSIHYLQDIYYTHKRVMACILIILSIIFLIVIWKEIFKVTKVIVDSQGIKIHNYKSSKLILFSEIEKIEIHKAKTFINGIQITDGYSYSELKLKSKPSVVISPDKFENYIEIMQSIKNNLE